MTVEEAEQVPASTTYEAWLKRLLKEDPALVRSVLGKVRSELFEAGKLCPKTFKLMLSAIGQGPR